MHREYDHWQQEVAKWTRELARTAKELDQTDPSGRGNGYGAGGGGAGGGAGPLREMAEADLEILRTSEAIESIKADIARNDDTIAQLLSLLQAGPGR